MTRQSAQIKANGDDDTARNQSTATVWVGCKLPHGLICELGMGTSEHRFVKLRGGRTNKLLGVGVTRAPRDFMERWMRANRDLDFCRNTPNRPAQIWLADTEEACTAAAVSVLSLVTGFEPLDGGQIPKEIEVDNEHLRKMGVSVKGV